MGSSLETVAVISAFVLSVLIAIFGISVQLGFWHSLQPRKWLVSTIAFVSAYVTSMTLFISNHLSDPRPHDYLFWALVCSITMLLTGHFVQATAVRRNRLNRSSWRRAPTYLTVVLVILWLVFTALACTLLGSLILLIGFWNVLVGLFWLSVILFAARGRKFGLQLGHDKHHGHAYKAKLRTATTPAFVIGLPLSFLAALMVYHWVHGGLGHNWFPSLGISMIVFMACVLVVCSPLSGVAKVNRQHGGHGH